LILKTILLSIEIDSDFVVNYPITLKEPIYYKEATPTRVALPLVVHIATTQIKVPFSNFDFDKETSSEICYHLIGKQRVPIAWTAPECLETMKWNKKSDVWSWGVLMWELFTFGERPNRCKTIQRQLLVLKNGTRLKQPSNCSNEVWKLIQNCWEFDKNKRPDFVQIRNDLQTLLDPMMCGAWSVKSAYDLLKSKMN